MYDCVVIFHKMTSLASYFAANEHKLVGHLNCADSKYAERYSRIKQRYTRERPVRLILLVRYTSDRNVICKINCPVNPLPVKDEFEAPSLNAVVDFLKKDGWNETESLPKHLLK